MTLPYRTASMAAILLLVILSAGSARVEDDFVTGLPVGAMTEIYSAVIEWTAPCAGEDYLVYDKARTGNIGRFWAREIETLPERYLTMVKDILADTSLVMDLGFLSAGGYRIGDQESLNRGRSREDRNGRIEHFWLSPIGLGEDGRTALVFRGYACGDKSGFGAVLLHYIEGAWKVDEETVFRER